MINYSVIIRTTGKAGLKYQKLLDSVSKLEPKPREVIVVLPENSQLPPEKLGWEKYYFCKKGMVSQRLFGIYNCTSRYALICDDDVCFERDFVTKLHQPIQEGVANLSAGPLLSYLPPKGYKSILYSLTGAAVPRWFANGKYISVLSTTGYSYYRKINTKKHMYFDAESLPWTCFYGEIDALKKIHLEDERWLELHGYACMDDQTMFYKAHLLGIKTVVVSDAVYQHLDAKTSRKELSDIAYSMEFNRYIFWHRFIYCMDGKLKKVWDIFCIAYYFGVKSLYNVYRYIKGELDKDAINAKKKALKDAKKYVKTEEYKGLPKIRCIQTFIQN